MSYEVVVRADEIVIREREVITLDDEPSAAVLAAQAEFDRVVARRSYARRLRLAMRLSVLEAERDRARDEEARIRALHADSLCAATVEAERCGRLRAEESAAKGWAMHAHAERKRNDALDEVSDAKERLAKLTGSAFVHGPSLADHVGKVEKLVEGTHRPAERLALVLVLHAAQAAVDGYSPRGREDERMVALRRAVWAGDLAGLRAARGVVVDEDDGDPA